MDMVDSKRFVALATANVGVGPSGTTPMIARVVIVDFRGNILVDVFVKPTTTVTDYRTATTGIDSRQLYSNRAQDFAVVQQYVARKLRGKIIVGHSIWQDLSVLGIPHPAIDTRDVALYQPFRNSLKSPHSIIGLQTLCWHLMNRRCQEGRIDPVENSRVALDLYRSAANEWEAAIVRGNWPCALPPSSFSRCYQ